MKKLIWAVALTAVVVAIVGVYLHTMSQDTGVSKGATVPASVQSDTAIEETTTAPQDENNGNDAEMDMEAMPAAQTGVHIMPDGSVMANDGTTLPTATVTEDGMVKLEDGTIITPSIDMRPAADKTQSSEETSQTQLAGTKVAHAAETETHHTYDVVGKNYSFDVKQITVKKGDTVTVNLYAGDGYHDWVVDEFNAATKRITEGNSASVTFVADKVGVYEFYCSVGNHRERGMYGYLTVME